jgi:predicted dehydrogenase
MKTVTAIMIGAGDRGLRAYGAYAKNQPEDIKFIAVVDLDEQKRKKFAEVHGITDDMVFDSWEPVFSREKFADAVFICTSERFHYVPTKLAMKKGYHILLEKPITTEPATSLEIGELAQKYDKTFMLGYVLRYTPFFYKIKQLIDSGIIGKLRTIQHTENVGIDHYSHSYVRGVFSKESNAGPMLLSKSCHDMDILNYISASVCKKVASFGTKSYFREENAPEGAPDRCTDGCPVSDSCRFFAPRMYLSEKDGFNVDMISVDTSPEAKMEALRNGPFGRCVYRCDNDVLDQQVISMDYENEITMSFVMNAYSFTCDRRIRIMGSNGEIRGHFGKNQIEIYDFQTRDVENYQVSSVVDRHGGGDYYIMNDFIKMVRTGLGSNRTNVADSLMSHVMCFASEKARKEGRVIDLEEYMGELRNSIK